jgi:hypothetical protein
MSLAAVLQHVHVLEACDLIRSAKLGRTRTCSINPTVLRSAESWIVRRRRLVERRVDRLGEYRAETAAQTTTDTEGSDDRSFRHPRHVHDRANLPGGGAVPGVRRLASATPRTSGATPAAWSRRKARQGSRSSTSDPEGRERFGITFESTILRYDALYYDIVPEQRILYSYEMYADDARISVSVATIELTGLGAGTALTWTEQGAYLVSRVEGSRLLIRSHTRKSKSANRGT